MHKRFANPELENMLKEKSAELGEALFLCDLACIIHASRQAIHTYSMQKKPFPILERKLAAFFDLTPEALRHRLFNTRTGDILVAPNPNPAKKEPENGNNPKPGHDSPRISDQDPRIQHPVRQRSH